MTLRLAVTTEKFEGIDQIRDRLGNSGGIRSSITPVLREAARIGAQSARIYAPRGRTGNLEREIKDDAIVFRIRGDVATARFGVQPVPNPGRGSRLYPMYVHEGTGLFGRLHRLITPKRAPAMVFPGGGKPWPITTGSTGLVVKRSIKGQKPNRYMKSAFDDASAYVEMHLDEIFQRLVD